jgi:Tfp pilus assembly protein PilP
MSINKKLLYIVLIIFTLNLSLFTSNAEEKVNLDDEELPAIDPFQGNSTSMNTGQMQLSNSSETVETKSFINDLRLVGTIIGKKKKFAILSAPDGSLLQFKEDEQITENERLVFILEDYILVTVFDDEEEKSYEVYMNYVVKESKDKKE